MHMFPMSIKAVCIEFFHTTDSLANLSIHNLWCSPISVLLLSLVQGSGTNSEQPFSGSYVFDLSGLMGTLYSVALAGAPDAVCSTDLRGVLISVGSSYC